MRNTSVIIFTALLIVLGLSTLNCGSSGGGTTYTLPPSDTGTGTGTGSSTTTGTGSDTGTGTSTGTGTTIKTNTGTDPGTGTSTGPVSPTLLITVGPQDGEAVHDIPDDGSKYGAGVFQFVLEAKVSDIELYIMTFLDVGNGAFDSGTGIRAFLCIDNGGQAGHWDGPGTASPPEDTNLTTPAQVSEKGAISISLPAPLLLPADTPVTFLLVYDLQVGDFSPWPDYWYQAQAARAKIEACQAGTYTQVPVVNPTVDADPTGSIQAFKIIP